LAARLDDQAATLESEARRRIEATCRSIERRAILPLAAWQRMLGTLDDDTPPEYIDWLAVERSDGRDVDVGFFRHWIDPTIPFAAALLSGAHGAVITSATLTDSSGDAEADWAAAEQRTGAIHLPNPAIRAQVPSPFDYAAQTRAIVVTDLVKGDMAQVAAAYRELFLAAGGGALGLFTAISRLRAVHGRIGGMLEEAGLNLYAQHVDGMDVATLVDIFRDEEDSCLLGTDAVRDGIDVPGRSLRLIVFDRVPWPRPDLAHKARRAAFGGRTYDDALTRLRLRQAFGRLVRRGDDRGVFVLLDSRLPSRLASAFPKGVEIQRLGLAEAVASTREFLTQTEDGK
ncbi:MAG: helicase C-terminal domain-containing protein, partial [Alphaproteobacteria bacterium]